MSKPFGLFKPIRTYWSLEGYKDGESVIGPLLVSVISKPNHKIGYHKLDFSIYADAEVLAKHECDYFEKFSNVNQIALKMTRGNEPIEAWYLDDFKLDSFDIEFDPEGYCYRIEMSSISKFLHYWSVANNYYESKERINFNYINSIGLLGPLKKKQFFKDVINARKEN